MSISWIWDLRVLKKARVEERLLMSRSMSFTRLRPWVEVWDSMVARAAEPLAAERAVTITWDMLLAKGLFVDA